MGRWAMANLKKRELGEFGNEADPQFRDSEEMETAKSWEGQASGRGSAIGGWRTIFGENACMTGRIVV